MNENFHLLHREREVIPFSILKWLNCQSQIYTENRSCHRDYGRMPCVMFPLPSHLMFPGRLSCLERKSSEFVVNSCPVYRAAKLYAIKLLFSFDGKVGKRLPLADDLELASTVVLQRESQLIFLLTTDSSLWILSSFPSALFSFSTTVSMLLFVSTYWQTTVKLEQNQLSL